MRITFEGREIWINYRTLGFYKAVYDCGEIKIGR
jgi:hypothetical protein